MLVSTLTLSMGYVGQDSIMLLTSQKIGKSNANLVIYVDMNLKMEEPKN